MDLKRSILLSVIGVNRNPDLSFMVIKRPKRNKIPILAQPNHGLRKLISLARLNEKRTVGNSSLKNSPIQPTSAIKQIKGPISLAIISYLNFTLGSIRATIISERIFPMRRRVAAMVRVPIITVWSRPRRA